MMRRSASERGKQAAKNDLHLGASHVGRVPYMARYPNLVAEPMGFPGRYHMCCVFRTMLAGIISIAFMMAGLELLVTDYDVTSLGALAETPAGHDEVSAGHVARSLSTTAMPLLAEPNAQAIEPMNFQLTVTLDVQLDRNDHVNISLANQTGFYAAYFNDLRIRDGHSPSFDATRTRVLAIADEALRSWTDGSDRSVVERKLQDEASGEFAGTGDRSFMHSHAFLSDLGKRVFKWFHLNKRITLGRSSNWTLGVIVLISGFAMCASVCHMQPPFRPHPMQQGPRSNVHQSDAGPPFVGTATLKVPPSWCVERNHIYTLRSWISDLILWASASDLDPIRHGPVAALQVQGTAKELIRELTPHQLQHGDVDPATGQQLTGLMLLVSVLARRYAPLEAENTTKSIAEFLSFRRQPGEGIDSVLVRFDILRNRAQARAGFAVNWTGLSWLLLQSLGLNAEMWDRLLAPLGGQMPQNEFDLGGLMERIRRLFHLKEGRMNYNGAQGAMGDPGNFFTEGYFPTFMPDGPHAGAYVAGGPSPPDPWANASIPNVNAAAGPSASVPPDVSSWQQMHSQAYPSEHAASESCPTCGVYFREDGFSTDTSSDDGTEAIPSDSIDPAEAYLEYAFARKKWRRVSHKFPRRYRKFGKGGKGQRPNSYAAFLPPNAFAGGKGGGGNKGKQGFSHRKKNPKDKNGQILRCNICQSDEHLWRNCTKRSQQSDGAYATAAMQPSSSSGFQSNQAQLALMPSQSTLWGPVQATSLPGVHFFGTELENLRSVSQAGSVVSSGSRKRTTVEDPEPVTPNAPTKTAPRWSPGFFPHAGVSSTSLPEIERLIPSAPEPSSPPPAEPAPTEHTVLLGVRTDQPDQPSTSANVPTEPPTHVTGKAESRMSRDQQERVREQSIQGLQNVLLGIGSQADQHASAASNAAASANPTRHVLNLDASITRQTMWPPYLHATHPQPGAGGFPWWEVDESTKMPETSYHLRTRRQNGEVALLVDPGAHDNLVGSLTAQQMVEELNAKLRLRSLDKPLPVEGVGKTAQIADKAACISMSVLDVFGEKLDATYTAPIIHDSLLPPLLGNRTLRKMQVIMDCGSGKLIIPGPGGVEVKMSPGSRVFDLELTSSGHWVLPLHARSNANKEAEEKELSFNMSCREDRSQSPPKRRDGAGDAAN